MTIEAGEYVTQSKLGKRIFIGVDGELLSGYLLQNVGRLKMKLTTVSAKRWCDPKDPSDEFVIEMDKVWTDPNITTKREMGS